MRSQIPPVMAMNTQNNHLQPISWTMYPETTRANGGPNVLLKPYTIIAIPLLFLSQRSDTVPPVFVNGAEPPNPWMRRQTMTVAMFGARASGSWNMKRINQEPI